MQVYELAIELGVRSGDIVARARELGIGELTPTDALTAQQVAALRTAHGFDAGGNSPTVADTGPVRSRSSGTLIATALLVVVIGATVTMFAWLAINDEAPEQADAAAASSADEDELDFTRRDECAAWERFEIRGEAAGGEVGDAVTLNQLISELESTKSALGEAYLQLKPFTDGQDRQLVDRYHSLLDGMLADALAAPNLGQMAEVLEDPQRSQAANETWDALKASYEDC